MTSVGFKARLLLLAILGVGCGASSSGTMGHSDASSASWGGAMGAGGMINLLLDAASRSDGGYNTKRDAGSAEVVQANLSSDAAVFDWDAHICSGCATTGGGSGGSSGGAKGGTSGAAGSTTGAVGGSVGVGGYTGAGFSGGARGTGGVSSTGGVPGKGGSSGSGGASISIDASVPVDARQIEVGGSMDTAVLRDAGADTYLVPDATVSGPGDSLGPDTSPHCVAQIEAVVPTTASLERLVAGANVRVVLRAEVISGGPTAGASWTWKATRDGTSIALSAVGQNDPSAVAFPIANEGNYTFTALDKTGACSATAQASAVSANACGPCDKSVILRAAPPAISDIPVQSGAIALNGSSPFNQTNVVLARGVAVEVSPSTGSTLVASYVRINSIVGDLITDGMADPKTGGFSAQLLDVDPNSRALLKYDVLVVPLDSSNGDAVAATAPQLFQNLTPANINSSSFGLGGGVTVTGTTKRASTQPLADQPVGDVRVMLTNQDPSGPPQPSQLIFSSVGRSATTDGSFLLHAQPGKYWISISPPDGSGLAEALAPSAVTLNGDTTLDFKWDVPSMSTLVLNVVDAAGVASIGTRVRLTSAQSRAVGTLTVGSAGASSSQIANGNVQVEGTTDRTGQVTFANLPDGASYNVLLVPAILGQSAATTTQSLTVPVGGATQNVRLLGQGSINGRLVAGLSGTVDWTRVGVIAYDRSNDTPEAPSAVAANPDGTFSMGLSPGRPYVVLAVPDVSTGLARTFVGPGPLQTSEFTITQNVQAAMAWTATVMDETQNGLSGTALQVFCGVTWPNCIDPTIPLAETTSQDSGAFQLALPDPATR